jgi:hypothetical protein
MYVAEDVEAAAEDSRLAHAEHFWLEACRKARRVQIAFVSSKHRTIGSAFAALARR